MLFTLGYPGMFEHLLHTDAAIRVRVQETLDEITTVCNTKMARGAGSLDHVTINYLFYHAY